MDLLPLELLNEIASQDILSDQDLTNLACVNRRFREAACARLYRSGELSYVGATDKDAAKVDSYGKNGKFVRSLKLNLFALPSSPISIPTSIFPLLTSFVNLHRLHLTDTASLPWPSFIHILAIITTSHPYLKILELQRTLHKNDGNRSDISASVAFIESHTGPFAKLEIFILRLAKREGFQHTPRSALNDLITILTPSTRSAKAFLYASEAAESPELDRPDPITGKEVEPKSWTWDNLEELTLKLAHKNSAGYHTGIGISDYSYQKDLHNVKRLAVKVTDVKMLPGLFLHGFSAMPKLEIIRISQQVGFINWSLSLAAGHPFSTLAELVPTLKVVEQTDSYYMTQAIQSLTVVRSDDGTVSFKQTEIKAKDGWIGQWVPEVRNKTKKPLAR